MALNWPLVERGNQSENVRSVQYFLNAHGQAIAVDGSFGPLTQGAVRAFQSANGLGVDGIVGNQTWPVLLIQTSTGSQGDAVKAVQSQVASRKATPLTIDGIFGQQTHDAVEQFQNVLGLSVDCIAGPFTWNYFANGYLPGPAPNWVALVLYEDWSHNDPASATKNATATAVSELFSQSWSAAAGWSFFGDQVAAGTVYFTWQRSSGEKISIGVSDGPGGYFYGANVVYQ
jgi:peptidoglycan hydrolase-like protein with peptidoglycan-binding domain